MSHHGREGEVEICGERCARINRESTDARDLIRRIAIGIDPGRCLGNVQLWADNWLRDHGYVHGEALRARAARDRRAEDLDLEIARLRAERASL